MGVPRDAMQCPVDSNDVHSMLLLYCLSKAAVLFGVKIQADEPYMKARGVTVVAVCPGWCQVCSELDRLPTVATVQKPL